jgi:hypothetical protein
LVGAGRYDSNLTGYGGRMGEVARERIFVPYLRELEQIESMLIGEGLLASIEEGMRRDATGIVGYLRRASRMARHAKAALAGNIVTIGTR